MLQSGHVAQHLAAAKNAELRRDQRDPRIAEFRQGSPLRITRPLLHWRSR